MFTSYRGAGCQPARSSWPLSSLPACPLSGKLAACRYNFAKLSACRYFLAILINRLQKHLFQRAPLWPHITNLLARVRRPLPKQLLGLSLWQPHKKDFLAHLHVAACFAELPAEAPGIALHADFHHSIVAQLHVRDLALGQEPAFSQ